MYNSLKPILALIILGSAAFSVKAQNVAFAYDGAGNRISRQLIMLSMSSMMSNTSSFLQDTLQTSTDTLQSFNAVSNQLPSCTLTATPNPVQGEVTITITGGDEQAIGILTLHSREGELIQTINSTGNAELQIDMSPYEAGMYLINFQQGENKAYYKLIKID
jgi:hypothetical protein